MNMEPRKAIFVTGRPGVGKSTLVRKVSDRLKARGYRVGGMLTAEIRRSGVRVGFAIVDLESGCRGVLAHVEQRTGPRIGKYRVNLKDLDSLGVNSIERAIERADVILIDEIGPMELKSKNFFRVLKKAVDSEKPLLATVHYRLKNRILQTLALDDDRAELVEINLDNRDRVADQILDSLNNMIKESEG